MTGVKITPGAAAKIADVVRKVNATGRRIGAAASPRSVFPSRRCWMGVVVDTGPAAEADYDDERYWVKRVRTANDTDDLDEAMTLEILDTGDPDYFHGTVTNISEIGKGSHDLEVGDYIVVFFDEDRGHDVSGHTQTETRYWTIMGAALLFFLGGHFNAVGAFPANGVAVWNGNRWTALLSQSATDPPEWVVKDAAVYDGVLYVCGTIPLADLNTYGLAKWDGTDWIGVSEDTEHVGTPECLIEYDGELWVCGSTAGGTTDIASFDGASWTDRAGPEGPCYRMQDFGGSLYVVGQFELCGGVTVNSIAVWDGAAWSAVGDGLTTGGIYGTGRALAVHDDGDGEGLYIGGDFDDAGTAVGCNNVVLYRGGNWIKTGDGIPGTGVVLALCSLPTDEGAGLYATTDFNLSGRPLMFFDGAVWGNAGDDLSEAAGFTSGLAMAVYRDALHVSGGFDNQNQYEYSLRAGRVARSKLPGVDEFESLGAGMNGAVHALTIYDGRLVAGGAFTLADNRAAERLARWDEANERWDAWAEFSASVRALLDVGGDLYVGGSFTTAAGLDAARLIRFIGGGWFTFGGVNGPVFCLSEFGGKVIIGGRFTLHDGAPPVNANAIVSYDPGTGTWAAFDDGFTHDTGDAIVFATIEYGGDLHACGRFKTANGVTVNYIARWDGAAWQPLGGGLNGEARCMAVFGGNLYVGGAFTDADGVTVRNIAQWDGANWTAVGSAATSPSEPVDSMIVYDDGGGDDLYVDAIDLGTIFVPGTGLNRVRRWSGAAWSYLDGSFSGNILAMTVGDSGDGTDRLHVGGEFGGAGSEELQGGAPANRIMRFDIDGWSNIGGGIGWVPRLALGISGGSVYGLRALTIDDKTNLYAVGQFQVVSNVLAESVAKLTSKGFETLGRGVRGVVNVFSETFVHATIKHDDGTGLATYVTGNFSKYINETDGVTDTGAAAAIARFKAGAWEACGSFDDIGYDLARFPSVLNVDATLSGTATMTAAAGTFADNMVGAAVTVAGGTGGNAGTYFIAAVVDDTEVEITGLWPGTVPDDVTITVDTLDLYACGQFSDWVRKWNGTAWAAVGNLGALVGSYVPYSMVQFDGKLWVAGETGGDPSVWRWDGSGWSDVSPAGGVQCVYLLTNGVDLYLGVIGGVGVAAVRKWNGSGWDDVGTMIGEATGLAFLTGPDRIAAFGALDIGGTPVDVAVWDGATWTDIGTLAGGGGESVYGRGATLWIGGRIDSMDAVTVRELARWDGTNWSAHPKGGANSTVYMVDRP